MIISKISHGLGNQLFQYAIARKLSIQAKTSLYFDLRYYNHHYATDTFRSFRLNNFKIDYQLLDTSPVLIYLSKATKLFPQRSLPPLFELVREGNDGFNARALTAKSMFVYLSGFWQTEQYFKDIQDVLQKEITLKIAATPQFQKFEALIKKEENPISLHIRRGDYVNNSQFSNQFGFIGLDYYKRATDMFQEKMPSCKFFVFSDDFQWVKENFPQDSNTVYVESAGDNSDLEDLMLMRTCKHHIIANSSFSWWGAWLNSYPGKMVVAPQKWYNNMPDLNTNDLIPADWLRM
ncbi:alpha-1,2-fucosyltransferase [Dyadobacter sp. CY323]|uniref:alpha-1,2-fucosyltransferase n=1 Tax=Dyadobacter sp. CY323 TaxID=2907302 RepID=UPI001F1E86F7|nr:alpha-1,2-fucosyltransferase [Dyadobacter sp. CY323]MCE6987648.1 alpha-1,2-fucosyltransferase [Dyadobacter sp. CY323]